MPKNMHWLANTLVLSVKEAIQPLTQLPVILDAAKFLWCRLMHVIMRFSSTEFAYITNTTKLKYELDLNSETIPYVGGLVKECSVPVR